MQNIDIYVGEDKERRKRRRGKWLIPIFAGIGAALVLGREKPAATVPPSGVIAPPPIAQPVRADPPANTSTEPTTIGTSQTGTSQTSTSQTSTSTTGTSTTTAPAPGHIVVTPARLDFGDGPLTRGVPAQMATIRNDGSQAVARVSAIADGPFMATNGCTDELKPGDRCMIAVVFTPKQPGRFAGSLKITVGQDRAQIPLHGSVPRPREVPTPPVVSHTPPVVPVTPAPAPAPVLPQPPPPRVLCFEPANLHFVSTGRQTITLTNPEPVPLQVVGVVPVGRQGQTVSGYEIESKKCLRLLKAGERCTFTIRASQLALQMHETMHVTVYYDDPATGSVRAARFNTACGGR